MAGTRRKVSDPAPEVVPDTEAVTDEYVRSRYYAEGEPTAWVGWVLFAGVMMVMLGFFQGIAGLVAIFDDGYYDVPNSALTVHADYTAWGVVHMVLGLLAVIGGAALMVGQMWARVFAVVLAMVSMITNLAFVKANPFWSVMVIAIDALIIWAVCVHGREVKGMR